MSQLYKAASVIMLDDNEKYTFALAADKILDFMNHKKEERAKLERRHLADSSCVSLDCARDIIEIVQNNIDLLIEIKDALDSAPQSATNNAMHDLAIPGTQFSQTIADRRYDDSLLQSPNAEPLTSRCDGCQTTTLQKNLRKREKILSEPEPRSSTRKSRSPSFIK